MRGATPSDDPEIGRILWAAFGSKMRAFLGDRAANAYLIADLFREGALRRECTRVATNGDAVLGVCLVRLPDAPCGSVGRMARVALRHAGLWRMPWAMAGLLMFDEPARPAVAMISLLAVAPAARGRGGGSALLRAVEAEARARGLSRLGLQVIENNPARNLYARHGFRTVRTHRIPRPIAALLGYAAFDHMEKRLV